MDQDRSRVIDSKYVDVLDGIRAISVIIVLIFHFWQQTWIFPVIKTPFLAFIGLHELDFTPLARVGYLFVDMMVLISGFLLFLPVMRQIFLGEDMISWKEYARRRIARILPSYLFAVLLLFFAFALPRGDYSSTAEALRDLFTHLTFTQTLFRKTYLSTNLDVVLWTVAIEVWFYILFPFFAEMIRRRRPAGEKKSLAPSVIAIAAIAAVFYAVSYCWRRGVVDKPGCYLAMHINQLPAFMSVYANGMIGALVYTIIAKHAERRGGLAAAATILSIFTFLYIAYLIKDCAKLNAESAQHWQVDSRFCLTAAFTVFIISTALSARWYRFIFSNKLMVFLSGISYNLYIWHQWLAVQLKNNWRIPYWEGTKPPNQNWDHVWMNKYAFVITVAAFLAAILATYLIEKPFANLIMGRPMFGRGKAPLPARSAGGKGPAGRKK